MSMVQEATSGLESAHHEDASVEPRRYRQRIYGHYVSAFKGRPKISELQNEFQARKRVFDHILKPLLTGVTRGSVIEVACGQGQFLYWALEHGFAEVHGCDLSAEQVAVAREMGLPAKVAPFSEFLPDHRGRADLVVGMDIIEHLDRDEAFEFLDLCFQTLQPGGHIYLTLPNAAAYRPGPVQAADLTHETAYSPDSIAVALRLAGFAKIEVREIPPPPVSWKARLRGWLWSAIRLWPQFVDMVETGAAGKVLTRVMAVKAQRPVL